MNIIVFSYFTLEVFYFHTLYCIVEHNYINMGNIFKHKLIVRKFQSNSFNIFRVIKKTSPRTNRVKLLPSSSQSLPNHVLLVIFGI